MRTPHRVLRPVDFKRTPWKNGLGWTDQIAIFPEAADLRRGDFDWRISSARVAQSADFSPFADHDRVLVVLDGAGVNLKHRFDESEEPELVELPPWEPYEFPGDVPTRCDLREGPIQDFSVFIRKGIVSAMVETVELSDGEPFEWQPQGRVCFVFVGEGSLDAAEIALQKGELLRLDREANMSPDDMEPVQLRSDGARALLVQLDFA